MQSTILALFGLVACANAFTVATPFPHRSTQCARVSTAPTCVISYKLAAAAGTAAVVGGGVAIKKVLDKRPKKDSPEVAATRAALSSMSSLSDLSEMKLEQDGTEGRVVGVWKEYIKSDGRKWYYNTETRKMTWMVPDEIKKLDEVSAAAAKKNEERGA
mmetsp:Transcript_23731/g.60688  ORF Transcript_23731/g.60688 Transcript_23731/m.60688 type:complete len:159 (-) Transcript_23731:212-688(-)